MLARLRKATEENQEGFTLIELLVVVVIIGILAAIAIPTFLSQREKAWQRAAQSDLRNTASVMETWFSDNGTYDTWTPATVGYEAKASDDVTFNVVTQTATAYCIEAAHGKIDAAKAYSTQHLDSTSGKVEDGTC